MRYICKADSGAGYDRKKRKKLTFLFMNMKLKAYFYYDIISPYAYLLLKSRKILEDKLELIPVPIFFPGLLRLQDNRGPA